MHDLGFQAQDLPLRSLCSGKLYQQCLQLPRWKPGGSLQSTLQPWKHSQEPHQGMWVHHTEIIIKLRNMMAYLIIKKIISPDSKIGGRGYHDQNINIQTVLAMTGFMK